jgi:hypothetical protein
MDAAVTVRLPQGDKGTRTEAAADVTGEVRRHVPAFVERLLGAGEGLGDSAAVASELHGKEKLTRRYDNHAEGASSRIGAGGFLSRFTSGDR